MDRLRRFLLLQALCLPLWIASSPAPSAGVPDPEELRNAALPERVQLLRSFGMNEEAEHLLRFELDRGITWPRLPLVQLLLDEKRYGEAGALIDSWGGAEAVVAAGTLFADGRVREGQEDWPAAAAAYALSAAREPLLSDHAAYRAGLARENAGELELALAHFEEAAASARTADLGAQAHWRAATLAAALGDTKRALASLERIPARSVISRADLLDLEAKIYRADEQPAREARVLRELFDRAPSSEIAIAAIERLAEIEEPTVADRVSFAEAAIRNRHHALAEEQALLALEELQRRGDPILEGRALVQYGKSLVSRRRLTKARDVLERMPAGADVEDRAEARLDRARCLWKLKQLDAALAEYDAVADDQSLPEEYRATAAWEAAREAKDNRRWREAALRLGEFQRRFPKHEFSDAALWHRGRALAELGEDDDAADALRRLRETYTGSPYFEEGTYWIAQLHRTAGREEEACREFGRLLTESPDSYWASRARTILAAHPCPVEIVPLGNETDPFEWLGHEIVDGGLDEERPRLARIRVEESDRFRRARALAAVGLAQEAEKELSGLSGSLARDPVGLVVLAEAAWRIGVPRASMRAILALKRRTGRQVLSGGLPSQVARLLYPLDHLDSVLHWAREYGVDPLFVYAVMREESWFDHQAISWAGAHGLLQIMPSTGRDLARRVGLGNFDQSDLFDPKVNIRLGAFYLSALLSELEFEPALALSAYNAGKGNALRWKKGIDGEFDVDRYVAGITYRETYYYVQRVTRSWAIYRHLYGELVPQLDDFRRNASSGRP